MSKEFEVSHWWWEGQTRQCKHACFNTSGCFLICKPKSKKAEDELKGSMMKSYYLLIPLGACDPRKSSCFNWQAFQEALPSLWRSRGLSGGRLLCVMQVTHHLCESPEKSSTRGWIYFLRDLIWGQKEKSVLLLPTVIHWRHWWWCWAPCLHPETTSVLLFVLLTLEKWRPFCFFSYWTGNY